MTEDINDLEGVICELNGVVYEQTNDDAFPQPFQLLTTGDAQCVQFLGETIWCSENDDRTYDKPTDSFTPIKEHLAIRAQQFLKKLSNIHLIDLP